MNGLAVLLTVRNMRSPNPWLEARHHAGCHFDIRALGRTSAAGIIWW